MHDKIFFDSRSGPATISGSANFDPRLFTFDILMKYPTFFSGDDSSKRLAIISLKVSFSEIMMKHIQVYFN